jgi:hypothetical protein
MGAGWDRGVDDAGHGTFISGRATRLTEEVANIIRCSARGAPTGESSLVRSTGIAEPVARVEGVATGDTPVSHRRLTVGYEQLPQVGIHT